MSSSQGLRGDLVREALSSGLGCCGIIPTNVWSVVPHPRQQTQPCPAQSKPSISSISALGLKQGPQPLGPQTGTNPWPVKNQAKQQAVIVGPASGASPVFLAAPRCSWYPLSTASCGSATALDSHRSTNPTVNCTCEGFRFHGP